MGTYPWGPHGPQSGPNQVTPNPTPAYVPPSSTPDWSAPAPSYGGGNQQPTYSGGGSSYTGPPYKSYLFALICASFFGPLGLFYASRVGGVIVLMATVGFPVAIAAMAHARGFYLPSNPFTILLNDGVISLVWRPAVIVSVIWSVFGVRRFNKASRTNWKG